MRKLKVEEAVGERLAHDITEVVPQKKKEVAFARGHVIRKADVKRFLDLGKRYVFVASGEEPEIHEEEAAGRMAQAALRDHMELSPAKEGRVNIRATVNGLLSVNRRRLAAMNRVKDVLFATLPDAYPVRPGDVVASTRIIPLSISEDLLHEAERIAREGIVRLEPFVPMRAGLVVTGTEVYTGRVVDGSSAVEEKLRGYGLDVIGRRIVPDEIEQIRDTILELFRLGADLVITTSGLSVDPDDLTKEGIEATGAKVVAYGAPVFPGAMFLIATLNGRYILGAPACVYYNARTALDVVLPRIMAGRRPTKGDLVKLAHGGLCLHCEVCHYPNCVFAGGC